MAEPSRITVGLHVAGPITCESITLPAGTVSNSMVAAGAAIDYTKVIQNQVATYSNESATTAVTEAKVVHVVHGATGVIKSFKCGCVVANIGDSTVVFDCKINGTTCLTGTVQVDSGDAAYADIDGTIDTAADDLVVGDVIEVSVAATVGTGTLGKGAFAAVEIQQTPE